jgi:hypothetical protein
MHDKIRVRAFAEFIKQYGEAELMACLERNHKAGVRYHYDGQLVGDYDQLDSVDTVIRKLKG